MSYSYDDVGDLTNRGADTSAWDYSYPTVISLGMAKGDIASGMPMLLDDGDARYVYGVAGCVSTSPPGKEITQRSAAVTS